MNRILALETSSSRLEAAVVPGIAIKPGEFLYLRPTIELVLLLGGQAQ
jgi:hypothetical protein